MKINDFYKRIASEYVELYGDELLSEREDLEREGPRITPGLDRKVKRRLHGGRRNRMLGGAALAAACLALMLLLPPMLERGRSGGPIAAPEEAPAMEAPMEAYDEDIAYDDAEAEAAVEADEGAPTGDVEILPLSFPLPEGFAVEDVKLDNGKSVYHLSNRALDDVVITLEAVPEQPLPQDLVPVPLGAGDAWGRSTADYSLLAFDWRGIRYELTCRHDINTLVGLGQNIMREM